VEVGVGAAGARGGHAPIVIASDSDFSSCRCVVSGSGTASDPYVIGPSSINNVSGVAVSIDGTNLTRSFTLSNLTIAGNASPSDVGIVLNHINRGGTQIGAQVTPWRYRPTSMTHHSKRILAWDSSMQRKSSVREPV
jgi:hypothetical protein